MTVVLFCEKWKFSIIAKNNAYLNRSRWHWRRSVNHLDRPLLLPYYRRCSSSKTTCIADSEKLQIGHVEKNEHDSRKMLNLMMIADPAVISWSLTGNFWSHCLLVWPEGSVKIAFAFHGRCIPFDHASGSRISACFFMFFQLLEPLSGKNINEVKTFMEKPHWTLLSLIHFVFFVN